MAISPSESRRLRDDPAAWRTWGPYLSERAWGTVREDYSEHGEAWNSFPHDHARSRVYRWNEDGLGGICDDQQRLCFAFAFWNGRDPILKERIFGLTGPEGNHGEDAKEYWWYLDSTPSHSWMRWRYLYPQAEFPYADLVAENRRRGAGDPEYELLDTGIFDGDRYWEITADYAKAAPDDLCIRVTVRNAAPDEQTIARCSPRCGSATRGRGAWTTAGRRSASPAVPSSPSTTRSAVSSWPGMAHPGLLICDNETNRARLFGADERRPVTPRTGSPITSCTAPTPSTPTAPAPRRRCTTASPCRAERSAEVRLRLSPEGQRLGRRLGAGRCAIAQAEADEFYAALAPADASSDEAAVLRQAFAGMLWSKQFFHYDVDRWLDGRSRRAPAAAGETSRPQPRVVAPQQRRRHLHAGQVGVPVVRGVGPGVPLRGPRPRRPRLRQGPAAAYVPRVVHAPQRADPRL